MKTKQSKTNNIFKPKVIGFVEEITRATEQFAAIKDKDFDPDMLLQEMDMAIQRIKAHRNMLKASLDTRKKYEEGRKKR